MSKRWILLVFEDGQLKDESICYAIKLAKRLKCGISVLMLAGGKTHDPDAAISSPNIVNSVVEKIKSENIEVKGELAHGDKASLFLKYLARHSLISAIVWGGDKEAGKGLPKKKGDNWFVKVKSSLPCPVVTPSIKEDPHKKIKKRQTHVSSA